MRLTGQDIDFFNEEGFLAIENAITKQQVDDIRYHLSLLKDKAKELEFSENGMNLEAPGGGFYSQSGLVKSYKGILRGILKLEKKDPFFADLAISSCIYHEIAKKVLPNNEVLFISANYWGKPAKVGSAQPWHQDLVALSPEERSKYAGALTIWIALDPATKENGCLEFYPGSHKLGYIPHLGSTDPKDNNQFHIEAEKLFPSIKPKAVELNPGSAVCFGGHVIHGSKKNSSDYSREAISFGYLYK